MKDMSSSLHKSDYILATESHRVYIAGYQYYHYLYGQKHKKAQWMHQLYILLKYGGSATKHKLYDQIGAKVVIIAKLIYSIKVKTCQFICNAQIHTHIYLN